MVMAVSYEREKLWNKVLSRRYGASLRDALGETKLSLNTSTFMKNLVRLQKAISQVLNPTCFRWRLFNGKIVYFWEDWWVNNKPLKSTFHHLYSLSRLKHVILVPRYQCGTITKGRNIVAHTIEE